MKIIHSETDSGELRRLLDRSTMSAERELSAVKTIIADVRARGDAALLEYTKLFDGARLTPQTLRVTEAEIDAAYDAVPEELLRAMRRSAKNIADFHEQQKQKTWMDVKEGAIVGQIIRPLASVGVYVPGGRAAYPSSVLMNVLPAVVAGVGRIAMVTPPDRNGSVYPLTLVAAREAGVHEIYKVGGAQAVAALAFGTHTIAKVDKITGPGNIYVALAKREVFGYVGIDMIAGPSEVLIIADAAANPAYAAADLLAQAEHDPLAAAILVTDSEALAVEVGKQIDLQLADLDRKDIAAEALNNHGALVVAPTLKKAVEIANAVAPEHLELLVQDPFALLSCVENAGAIFLGEHSPEPLGDYFAGPNHTLPTSGTARFSSPLSVDDFTKKSSVINYSRSQLEQARDDIAAFAFAEGLGAHAKSVAIRFAQENV